MNPRYFNKGQALLELAIFGSFLIMLLGILVNYGLRYNFQQRVMQEAFRKALASAAESTQQGKPTSVSYTLVRDKHIPDPSHPFAVGSVMPVSASAGGIVRNYEMQVTADTPDELPVTVLNIQGQELRFKTAGFREESNVSPESIDRYKEIYGGVNVWETGDAQDGTKNIKIIDSCAGEIINYDFAVRQCRQIVDAEVCIKECERGKWPGSETDCNNICSQPMNVPWYCQNYRPHPDGQPHRYVFPVLYDPDNNTGLFAFAKTSNKSMGLQQDYTQTASMDNVLRKTEAASGITTTDNINWQVDTQRKVVYVDDEHNYQEREVPSRVSQHKTQEWRTHW